MHRNLYKIIMLTSCVLCLFFTVTMASTMDDALMSAIQSDDVELVKMAIENGADVNKLNSSYSRTPLELAVWRGNIDIAKQLIIHGAKIHKGDFGSRTDNETYLMLATRNGKFDMIQLLVECGENVNARNKRGYTALHYAISLGRYDVVDYLINNNAEVNMLDHNGMTPLMIAASAYPDENMLNIVKLLLINGADSSKTNKKLQTALQLSINNMNKTAQNRAIVKLLLEQSPKQ